MLRLLLPLLACAPHSGARSTGAPEGWFPLGNSEISPWTERQTHAWRDAQVVGKNEGFEVAVDGAGRLWLASLESEAERLVLRVRVREGGSWREFPEVMSLPGGREHAGQVALTTDALDQPVVAWEGSAWLGETMSSNHGWAKWTPAGWTLHSLPPLPSTGSGPLGISAQGGARVYRYARAWLAGADTVWELDASANAWIEHPVRGGHLRRAAAAGGKIEWVVLDANEATVLWSAPDPVTAPPAALRGHPLLVDGPGGWEWAAPRSPARNTVADGRAGAPALLLEGYPHLVGTHYPNEVNRLRVWHRTAEGWEPLAEPPLATPLVYSEDVRLPPTAEPILVLGSWNGVFVLRWNGRAWWGLDGEPAPAGDLGDRALDAGSLQFVGSNLLWREHTDQGDRMRMASWSGTGWRNGGTTQLPGQTWVWGADSGYAHLLLRVRGTWDRVHGLMGEVPEPAMFTWDGLAKTTIPMPLPLPPGEGLCGAPGAGVCQPTSIRLLPSGDLLAVFHPDLPDVLRDEGFDLTPRPEPGRPWELQRFSAGSWSIDLAVAGSSWEEPMLGTGDPATLYFDDRLFVRGEAGWSPIPVPMELTSPVAVGLGGGRLLLTWLREPENPDDRYLGWRLHAAEWDGAAWAFRDAGLPGELVTDRALAGGPDGAPWLSYTTVEGEIRLLRWEGAAWVGLGGSGAAGGVSNSPAESWGAAIGFLDGNVCVAWSEAADLAARINVRCHDQPR